MDIKTRAINYTVGDVGCKGSLAYDAATEGPRPGIVVFGEWWGRDEFVMSRARELAKLGYVALAADVYGDAKVAADADEAGQLMQALLADMNVATARVNAAIDALGKQPQTDSARMGAMGYCLGGALALHAARLGLDLRGVVSFHGTLSKTHAAKPGDIKAKVLVCHAADDEFISAEELAGFQREMSELDADLKFVSYPGALHAFTNPAADENARKYGLALKYDAQLDARSWQEMRDHWEQVFKR